MTDGDIAYGSSRGRAVIAAATLGSGIALLDGTVVNVALKSIGDEFDASLAALQWITNGYLLALSALILIGASLGDRLGRRRVFVWGVVGFTAASVVCAVAPNAAVLVGARIAQGIGAALLTPGSLAMIQGAFRAQDRAPAIGAWSGLGSIAAAVGPLVGGAFVDYVSWRGIFLINVPIGIAAVWIAQRHVPETRDPHASGRFDVVGAGLGAAALGAVTFALINSSSGLAWPLAGSGILAGFAFVIRERRTPAPMMPLGLFRSRQFSAANVMTFLVYAALGAVLFFLVLQLQIVSRWDPLAAGLATMPITIAMILLAAKGGRLGAKIGPRIPMAAGPILCGVGTLLLLLVGPKVNYLTDVLPALAIFGIGLALLVAPLTATVLAAAPTRYAGIASGINNVAARAGSLLAVAAIPAAVGLSGADYDNPAVFDSGFDLAVIGCAALLIAGGVVSWLTIRNPAQLRTSPSVED